jgi:hypothetical protein
MEVGVLVQQALAPYRTRTGGEVLPTRGSFPFPTGMAVARQARRGRALLARKRISGRVPERILAG